MLLAYVVRLNPLKLKSPKSRAAATVKKKKTLIALIHKVMIEARDAVDLNIKKWSLFRS